MSVFEVRSASDGVRMVIRNLVPTMVVLLLVAGGGCKKPLQQRIPAMQTYRFPVDVTLTRSNLGWEHFTPSDYYNPAASSHIEVWIKAQYNKSGTSPGLYGWLRTTFADSSGHFSDSFEPYDYHTAVYNPSYCSAPVAGEDTAVMSFLGTVDVYPLVGGPGSGYSIAIWLAAAVPDAVADTVCLADTAVALDDTVHISEITYKVFPF